MKNRSSLLYFVLFVVLVFLVYAFLTRRKQRDTYLGYGNNSSKKLCSSTPGCLIISKKGNIYTRGSDKKCDKCKLP